MQPQFFPQSFDQIFQHSGLSRILCVVPDLLFLDLAVDKTYNEEDEEIIWTFDNQDDIDDDGQMLYYLVSTSGSMVKDKSSAKDGEDYEFEVEDYLIKSVTLED